jgi:hypothetical protein
LTILKVVRRRRLCPPGKKYKTLTAAEAEAEKHFEKLIPIYKQVGPFFPSLLLLLLLLLLAAVLLLLQPITFRFLIRAEWYGTHCLCG